MPLPILGLGIQGVHSEDLNSANQGFVSIVSVDAGSANAGQTIGASQTSQTTGYQLQAADTWFSVVTPGVTGNGNTPTAAAVLPISSSAVRSLVGAQFKVINTGANPINVYANPGDTVNSINSLAANLPVILGVNTITPFECVAPGIWFCDGIGEGQMGSIATVVSQGNIVSAGTSSGTATPITQALVNIASGTTGGTAGATLPVAKAGAQITVANNAGGTVSLYPNGTDTINGANAAITLTNATVTLCFCALNGAWLTK